MADGADVHGWRDDFIRRLATVSASLYPLALPFDGVGMSIVIELSIAERVLAILPTDKNAAFSPKQILDALAVDRRPDYIRQICRGLLQAGRVDAVKISYKDVRYYKINSAIPLSQVPEVPWLIKPQRSAA